MSKFSSGKYARFISDRSGMEFPYSERIEELVFKDAEQRVISFLLRLADENGKKVGDVVDYGGLLGLAPIMSVSTLRSNNFVLRGGRIPAPVRSLTN